MASARAGLQATVYGRVQGVGFRDYVWRNARSLGLSGWVRNLPDGRSLEVRAAGERVALERLLKRLREGPRLAHVGEVAAEWLESGVESTGFEIRY
jgi:acylphosphatase